MRLFEQGGLQAVTMRAVAAEVGVSAMALYRYFPNKAGLLRALWENTITELHHELGLGAQDRALTPRQRLRRALDVYLRYYEERPDYYRLIFMTEQTYAESVESRWAEAPIYREILKAAQDMTRDVAIEIGGDPARARLASDLRYALSTGYLHARLVNTRYPWLDLEALRAEAIEQIATAVENCLRQQAML
ncbi:MAG: helix-turn-helix domain-containing protein [Aquabacterium sp.]